MSTPDRTLPWPLDVPRANAGAARGLSLAAVSAKPGVIIGPPDHA